MRQNKLFNWWDSLTPFSRLLVIALAAPLLVINAWAFFSIFHYFHSLIAILIGASLLAFLLNYPVSWMEQHGSKRGRSAVVVFLLALSILLALGITLVPIVITQAQQLFVRLPEWVDSGQHQLMLLNERAANLSLPVNLDTLIDQITDRLKGQLQSIVGSALNLAVGTVTSLLDVLLTIVLAFYLLQHGDRLWFSLIEWLPAKVQQPFSETLRLSFQNFFIGQLILGICMGSALTLLFLLLKVPFGFLFGSTIGTMALVPFGGTVGIILVTLLVTLRDVWLGLRVLIAAVAVQQVLENFVAPRILGSFTGLNPVWVLISILTGARIGGLLGVIVAVPMAVVIKSALVAVRSRSVATAESSTGSVSELRSPHSELAKRSPKPSPAELTSSGSLEDRPSEDASSV
jgi:predicted PurR-regulated permease PerM